MLVEIGKVKVGGELCKVGKIKAITNYAHVHKNMSIYIITHTRYNCIHAYMHNIIQYKRWTQTQTYRHRQ